MRAIYSIICLLIWGTVALQNTPPFRLELSEPVICSAETAAESGMEMCCQQTQAMPSDDNATQGCCDEVCNPNAIWLQTVPPKVELNQIVFKPIENKTLAHYQAWCPNPFLETAVPPPDLATA